LKRAQALLRSWFYRQITTKKVKETRKTQKTPTRAQKKHTKSHANTKLKISNT